MTPFEQVLHADGEFLVKALYRVSLAESFKNFDRVRLVGASLRLTGEQFLCAFGFNLRLEEFTDVVTTLNFRDVEQVKEARNTAFISDVYERLTPADVFAIYSLLKTDPQQLSELQPLLVQRMRSIEAKLEAMVRPRLLNSHRAEIEAIYREGIAQMEFAEARLAAVENGFRGMVHEVQLIADAKLVPAGDIFFRDSVLPQEKRRLIERGVIPRELLLARLNDTGISPQERSILQFCLNTHYNSADDV